MRYRPPVARYGVAFLALVALVVCGCPRRDAAWGDGPVPKVAVSFAPLYCFAVNVAGDDATVKSVLTSQGPHHFDPKLSEGRLIAGADLFMINGLGLDDGAAEKMLRAAGNKTVHLVKLGDKLDPPLLLANAENEPAHEGHNHGHSKYDPHVWLGLKQAVAMVGYIRDELKVADEKEAMPRYDTRAAAYIEKLDKLKADGVAMLKDKKERRFVTFHESLRYFADTFGLEVADVIQKTPGKEPTAKELDALVKSCLDKKVRVIAVEPQYSTQTVSNRLVEELKLKGLTDVVLVEIDPLETANESDLNADWYETRLRANLKALADALK